MSQTNLPVAQQWLEKAPLAKPFTVPADRATWETQRGQIRAQLWELLGKLPPRPEKLQVQTLSHEDRGDYILEKFQFDNAAGATVPGYFLTPKGATGRLPAILYCHWHGGHWDVGKEELFRTNALPVPGGPALVKRGYAVMAIDAYGFGERNGKGPGGPDERNNDAETTASKFNLWVGRSLWGMIVRDDLIALDYLSSRPEIDPQRIGVTGISMGATRTWWVMALDERPRAGVAVACLTRYQNLILTGGLKYHGIYYFVPGMLNHFDTEAVVSLAAPRPMLFQTGDQDFGSPVDGVREIGGVVKKAYDLYGAADRFESVIYPGLGHVYTPQMLDRTIDWMDRYLNGTTR